MNTTESAPTLTSIQRYLVDIYQHYHDEVKKTLHVGGDELYGEIYYESLDKLIEQLSLTKDEHFLDVGSGVGKVVAYLALTTNIGAVTGIEIHSQRQIISAKVLEEIKSEFPACFIKKNVTLVNGDFLLFESETVSIAYVCSTIFSFALLESVGKKLNAIKSIKKIISFRKLPHLVNFYLQKKLFLHCSWDHVACYIYQRKAT